MSDPKRDLDPLHFSGWKELFIVFSENNTLNISGIARSFKQVFELDSLDYESVSN